MRRKQRLPLIIGILTLALIFSSIGFVVGYYRYSSLISKEKLERQKEQELLQALIKAQEDSWYNMNKGNETQVTSYGDIIGTNTVLINKILYTQCEDVIEEEEKPTSDLIGLNKKGFEDYLAANRLNWDLESFSKEEIILIKRENKVCPNDYVVSVNKGYIAVYKYDKDGEKKLIDQTEIPINVLPTVDQEKLQRGIIVKTLDEVNQLLEDYSS